ncbi:Hypothetical predicted protein [Cloeon dipterum]|uniref:Uncharacterized protein n=1 Tax=Cloeon dipterum TaxID=197152 RepID=A0A8S1DIT1_9INSE|nr:Hypothetical predicted protein [Cloeon dipterum]
MPGKIEPRYMAVFDKSRLFFSLALFNFGIPVTLVWLPINSLSPAAAAAPPPKLAPFPSWEKHLDYRKCDSIQASKGLEVDVIGRLWVLDGEPYRMLIDNTGTIYAAFHSKNYTSTWKVSQQLIQEQRFHESGKMGFLPFTFALSSSGTLWMMEFKFYESGEERYILQKAEVGVRPYLYNISTETLTTTTPKTLTSGKEKENSRICDSNDAKHQSLRILNTILSCWNVFCLFSIASQIYWFRKMKRMQDLIAKTKEDREKKCKEPLVNREIQPHDTSEPIYEEIDPVPSTSMHTAIADIHL